MAEPTIDTLVERLGRMERDNRWLKRLGVLLLIGIAALVLIPPLRWRGRVIEAEQIIIKDSYGKKRAELGTFSVGLGGFSSNFVGLSFYDINGSEVVFLGDLLGLTLKDYAAQINLQSTRETDQSGMPMIRPNIKLKNPHKEINLGFAESNEAYLAIGNKVVWETP